MQLTNKAQYIFNTANINKWNNLQWEKVSETFRIWDSTQMQVSVHSIINNRWKKIQKHVTKKE